MRTEAAASRWRPASNTRVACSSLTGHGSLIDSNLGSCNRIEPEVHWNSLTPDETLTNDTMRGDFDHVYAFT